MEIDSSGLQAKTALELKHVPKTSISAALSIYVVNNSAGGSVHLDIYALGSTEKFRVTGSHYWGNQRNMINIGLNASTPKTIEYQTSSNNIYGYFIQTVGYIDNVGSY